MKQGVYLLMLDDILSERLKRTEEHPRLHVNHAVFAMLSQAVNGYIHKHSK